MTFEEFLELDEAKIDFRNIALGAAVAAAAGTGYYSRQNKQTKFPEPTAIVTSKSMFDDKVIHQGERDGFQVYVCAVNDEDVAKHLAKAMYIKNHPEKKDISYRDFPLSVLSEKHSDGMFIVKIKDTRNLTK